MFRGAGVNREIGIEDLRPAPGSFMLSQFVCTSETSPHIDAAAVPARTGMGASAGEPEYTARQNRCATIF